MGLFDELVGPWPALVCRLDTNQVMSRWSIAEPVLAGVSSVGDLPRLTRHAQPARDRVFGAVVRTAAVGGGNDGDATLVVLHLMAEGATGLANRLADFRPRMLEVVVGELTAQIRQFPVDRRTRAYGSNLILDTKAALLRELLPTRWEIPCEAPILDIAALAPNVLDEPEVELDALLEWARGARVVTDTDVRLLRELQRGARLRLADAAGVTERTIRRRRDRALTALRQAVPTYLGDVA